MGCGDSNNNNNNKGESHASQGLMTEITSLREASHMIAEAYLKKVSEKKELSSDPSVIFLKMFSSLEEYDHCLGERKKSAQSCHNNFAASVNPLLINLKTFFSDMDKVADQKDGSVYDKQTIAISSLLLKLIVGKYFKLQDEVEHSHHVFSFPAVPSFTYSWTYSQGILQRGDLGSKITYDAAVPYFERAIGLKLSFFKEKISKEKEEEGSWGLLQNAFTMLNTNQLKINYSHQEVKSIWITKEIQEDDLKYASILYAFSKWEEVIRKPLFEFKGALEGSFDLTKLDGKNIIMLKSSLSNKDESPWDPWGGVSQYEVLGSTSISEEFEEKDVGFLKETSLKEGYCYEESIYHFLPSGSKFSEDPERFKKSLCSSTDDKRYNFVLLVLHELAHYLGYRGHTDDSKNLMYHTQSTGLSPYSFDGIVEKIFKENQLNSSLLAD